jgi:outer membrane protein OmpA-like peptidoglycan-associated protein
MTDGDANGCTTLDAVIKKIKSRKILFKTQAIAFDVAEYSNAYNDLKKISSISKGKFYHANGSDDLGSKFETASNDIFNLTSGGTSKDIFSLKLPPSMRPDFVATIKGKLTDSQNKIVDAQIKWEDLELNKPIGVSNVDPETGEYFIILPMGKLYGYYVDKNGYFPIANNLDLRKYNKPINITNDIKMVTIDEMKKQGVSVIANNLFFETNKSDLLPYSIPELERVAKIIKSTNQKIQIAGHTDDVGNVPANQLLSVKRAESVMKYLISLGCDPARISATGFGKSMPIADNKTEAGRAANRRVEVKFITL